MIGNAIAWGKTGYSIIEEGELNRQTWALDVHHYLTAHWVWQSDRKKHV